jgi:Ca-activated chloride channel family protein
MPDQFTAVRPCLPTGLSFSDFRSDIFPTRQILRSNRRRIFRSIISFLIALFVLSDFAKAGPEAEIRSAEEARARGLVRLSDMQSGALLFKATAESYYLPAPALATDIDIDVSGPVARAKVTQRFQNPSEHWLEGVYVFPLPENAAVDSLRMQIGSRFIEGKIKERQEARQAYEQAKAEGKKASLIEQERPNMFTNSVANIGPHETVIIQIEYQQMLQLQDDEFRLRAPLVVAPRYVPDPKILHMVSSDGRMAAAVTDPVPDRDKIQPPVRHPVLGPTNPVSLSVDLRAGFPLGGLESPSHSVKLIRRDRDSASVILNGNAYADRDFELVWRAKEGKAPTASLFHEERDGEHYILAMISPPLEQARDRQDSLPREIIFVIDNSGSMAGESIVQAKKGLILALQRLRPIDRFNVIRFDDSMNVLFESSVAATAEKIGEAVGFVHGLEADGGTEMLAPLTAALQDASPDDTSRLRQVVFLTDGAIGNEEELFAVITRHAGRSRIFTVGIGSAPNSFFMSRAAELGRGSFTYIASEGQISQRMHELFLKLENPVMTNLVAAWPGGTLDEQYPALLPDLYRGEPIVIAAKLHRLEGPLRLGGNLDGKAWTVQLPLDHARKGPGIAKLWAQRKIASLEALRYGSQDIHDLDSRVLETALEHHLVSRLTSLVAIDVTPSRPESETPMRTAVPLNLPKGWDFDKVFGEPHRAWQRDARALPAEFLTLAAINSTPSAVAQAGIDLPQTATSAPLNLMIGLLALIFAGASLLACMRLHRLSACPHGKDG